MGLINRSVKKQAAFPYRWLNHHLYAGWDKQSDGIGPEDGVNLYHPYKLVEFDQDGKTVYLQHLETGETVKVKECVTFHLYICYIPN